MFFFIRILSFLYTRLFLGFRCRDRYRIKKGESVLVLSNHQTDADPFCILPCFDRPVYPVATDNIFAGKFRSRLFSYLGVIPKKKGVSDLRAVMKMHSLLKNGGSVLLFPEGNRYYAEFRYHMLPLGKFIRSTGATVVIMNLAGALSYCLLEGAIIHSNDCEILKKAVSESRKEQWTICIELVALALSFVPGFHYASCPLLVVAVAPWIIPDLRMKKVFEEARRRDKN